MIRSLKVALRACFLVLIKPISWRIYDCRTGKPLGRALFIPWRGRILVIGSEGTLIPVFLPQDRLTYWKQELGFTTHPTPDFPSVAQAQESETPTPPEPPAH